MENLLEEKRLTKGNYYFFYQILPWDKKCEKRCLEDYYHKTSHPNRKSFLKKIIGKIIGIMKNFNPFYRNPPNENVFGAKFIEIINRTLIVHSHSDERTSITIVSTPVDWIIKVVSLEEIMGNSKLPFEIISIISQYL